MKAIPNRELVSRLLITLCFVAACGSLVAAYGQKEYSIAEIQGAGAMSPHDKEIVRITGIVTAIVKNGFYVQTPDDKNDKDPKTSDGILVYGPDSVGSVAIGNLVQVDGTVKEYAPTNEKFFLSITQIARPTVKVISKDNPLPEPVKLTAADLDPKGKLDQMERFEGMRVKADIVVVAPTGGFPPNKKTGDKTSNGIFFAALQGTPRPFREPGLEILTIYTEKLPTTTPAFDMNPELLRVNTKEQTGAKIIDVPAGATIKDLTGVIEYDKGARFESYFYSLYVDAANPPVVENIKSYVPVSPASEREVSIGSFNIENFFDDEENSGRIKDETILSKEHFQRRLNKVSLAIRSVLSMPDVLGIVEVENLKALQKLADKINADALATGNPSPKYAAYLEDGNDFRGINVGYLVKSTKIKVIETKQLAKDEKLDYPGALPDAKLFDRPPLMLRAEVIDAKATKPFAFTVVVTHIKSYLGTDDLKTRDGVINKRRLEAEWLANFVLERQKADPAERILLTGDFNAFQFNDGFNDLIGILKGKSNPNVLAPSKMNVPTGMAALVDTIPDPKSRYSYTHEGTAQAIDHILVNRPVYEGRTFRFGYAHVNADFPAVWSNNASRPERVSDHDAPVVVLPLDDPPISKPAATPRP